jgi:predicted nucleic acid-binding protein
MTDQAAGRRGDARIAVADAGPLIHLDELHCLELLGDFAEVWVPRAVWREVERHRPLALHSAGVLWMRCSPPPSEKVDALAVLYSLHAGERAALSLCMEFPKAILLSDDTAARLAAKTLTVAAHGTLGLLVRAIRRRLLSKAQVLALLRQLPERSSLHIRPGLLAEVTQQVAMMVEPE